MKTKPTHRLTTKSGYVRNIVIIRQDKKELVWFDTDLELNGTCPQNYIVLLETI